MNNEQKVSDTILAGNVVPFRVKVSSPGVLRLIGIKTIRFTIEDLYYGTLLKISPKLTRLKIQVTQGKPQFEAILEGMSGNIPLQAEIVAIAILNNPFKILVWTWLLKRFLIWNLDAKSMSQLVSMMLDRMNIMDFMTSIVSTGGLQVQRKETSPEEDTGGIIAPGTGSVE